MSGSLGIRKCLMHPDMINRRNKFRNKRRDDHVRARPFSSSPMSARSKPPKLDLAALLAQDAGAAARCAALARGVREFAERAVAGIDAKRAAHAADVRRAAARAEKAAEETRAAQLREIALTAGALQHAEDGAAR
jgi:hypothetical protein